MSNYNLDDEAGEDFFEFVLNGIQYRMRYPTTEEVEKQDKLSDSEKDKWSFSLITPVNDTDPSIEEALKQVNVKKVQRFTQMIRTEFGA